MSFFQLLRIDYTKLFHSRLWWISLFLVCLSVLGINGSFLRNEDTALELFKMPVALWQTVGFAAATVIAGIYPYIFVNHLVNHDYRDRTFSALLSRGNSRTKVLVSKFVVVILATCILTIASWIMNFLILWVGSLIHTEINFTLNGFDWLLWLEFIFAELILSMPYISLSFMLAIITKSTILTTVFPILFMIFISTASFFVTNMPLIQKIIRYLPSELASSITPEIPLMSGLEMTNDETLLSKPLAYVLLLSYIVVFMIITERIFQRKDLGG